jgi:hypothetical protein
MYTNSPLINIITRTSSRPVGFKKNRESVLNQTYKTINHIVSTDDSESVEYLRKLDVDYIFIDRDEIIKSIPTPNTRPSESTLFLPHNIYLNKIIKTINDGWIFYLDDDDHFANELVVESIVKNITSDDELIYWKMRLPDGRIIPDATCFNKRPVAGRIGGCCHGVHSKWKDHIKWDSWNMSDYRVMKHLDDIIPKTKWLDIVAVNKGNHGGLGRRRDI